MGWLRKRIVGVSIYLLGLGPFLLSVWAFDDDHAINFPDFNRENFLDIKSYQFRKQLEDQWYETESGWRGTGGSLGLDQLYVLFELKIRRPLSEFVTLEARMEQETFYAIKPLEQVLVELEIQAGPPLTISFLGRPAYDKRQADIGGAVTLGKRPWNYLKYTYLEQDLFYNEKNFVDASYYDRFPVETRLEGAYQWKSLFQSRFDWSQSRPFTQQFPEHQVLFTYEGNEGKVVLDYFYHSPNLIGLTYRGFDVRKARLATSEVSPENRYQNLLWNSLDLYWLFSLESNDSITLGFQYDQFQNRLRDLKDINQDFNYHLQTLQTYAILLSPQTPTMAWEYALYIGEAEEATDFLKEMNPDKRSRGMESKLRISWEYHTVQGKDTLLLSTTWNLDNLLRDFWDGGNVSYQTMF